MYQFSRLKKIKKKHLTFIKIKTEILEIAFTGVGFEYPVRQRKSESKWLRTTALILKIFIYLVMRCYVKCHKTLEESLRSFMITKQCVAIHIITGIRY